MDIQTWDQYVDNGQISQLDIASPYDSSIQVDGTFEPGVINPSKLGLSNLSFDFVTDNSLQSTTQFSPYVDVTNMVISFTITQQTRVLFLATVTGGANDVATGNGMYAIINVDGAQVGPVINVPGSPLTGGGVNLANGSGQGVAVLFPGPHVVKLQFRSGSIGESVSIENKFLSYLIIGN